MTLPALAHRRRRGVAAEDLRGDHWILLGALAITGVAAARLASAPSLAGVHGVLDAAGLTCWAVAVAWLPPLLLAEARAPGLPRARVERWATVFPLGMFALCSRLVGARQGWAWADTVATVFLVAGLVVAAALACLLTAAACAARSRRDTAGRSGDRPR